MADYTKAKASVDALSKTILDIQNCLDISKKEDILKAGWQFVSDITPLIAKLDKRSKEKDPITGSCRYGPAMLNKVRMLMEEFDVSSTLFFKLDESLKEDIRLYKEMLAKLEIRNAELAEMEKEDKRMKEIIIKLKEEEEESKAQEKKDKEEEERHILAMAAAREAYRQEERDRLALRQEEERQIREIIERERREQDLENSLGRGPEGFTNALNILQKNTSSYEFKSAKGSLLLFLTNICSRPENDIFRRIKAKNPYYYKDVGQFLGGDLCLKTLGFKEEIQEDDGEKVFFLEEPDINLDFEKWNQWLENLKSCKNLLEKKS